jgi:serine/threonine-protein kinase
VSAAARSGSAAQRLRALKALRDLGAEDSVDRVSIYAGLLADADCDVRRAAAKRLGELGDAAAVPSLQAAAGATRSEKRLKILTVKVPACGAAEAGEALQRIRGEGGATSPPPGRPAAGRPSGFR